jgi:hypothetical protein
VHVSLLHPLGFAALPQLVPLRDGLAKEGGRGGREGRENEDVIEKPPPTPPALKSKRQETISIDENRRGTYLVAGLIVLPVLLLELRARLLDEKLIAAGLGLLLEGRERGGGGGRRENERRKKEVEVWVQEALAAVALLGSH